MPYITRFISIIVFAVFSLQAWATPQQLQADLQQMRLSSTSMMTNYYMFTGLDLDSRYQARLEHNIETFRLAIESAHKLAEGSDLREEVDALIAEWGKFSQLMQTNLNDMINTGSPNIRLVNEMNASNLEIIELATAARDSLYKKSQVEPNDIIKQTRELAILMEQITSQYAARNTSNLGQVFAGNTEVSLVEMADEFSKYLNKLNEAAMSPRTEDVLYSIRSKWRFMEQRIRNYNENAVVFLVVSYNDKIIEHLHELEGLFL